MGHIYKITNTLNHKVYIGQTKRDPEQRWSEHKRSSNSLIGRTIKAVGEQHFSFEVIEEVDSSLLDEREVYWIGHFNSFERGYNQTLGGKGGNGLEKPTMGELFADDILNILFTTYSVRETKKYFTQMSATTFYRILKEYGITSVEFKEAPKDRIKTVYCEEIDHTFITQEHAVNFIKKYDLAQTQEEASIRLGLWRALNGKTNTYIGLTWRFV